MSAHDELTTHLRGFAAAPYLFVGSGLSRRYLGLDTWRSLLEQLAGLTGKPYAYYVTSGNGHLPSIASAIAESLHEIWWTADQFAESRELFGDDLSTREGPFKVEVARRIASFASRTPEAGPLAAEISALRNAVVDGIITTNYDQLLQNLFGDFKTYVGQDDLLFSDTLGIAEIYQIHGGVESPESIVITNDDFDRYHERNPYLAAKLLAMFVEHPIIFLGYSLSDENIVNILVSVAKVLTSENLSRLQDNLIFIEWDPDQRQATFARTAIAVEGFTIPIVSIRSAGFLELFNSLAKVQRKFPARVLRNLKEHVYELVRDNDPNGRLFVQDFDGQVDVKQVDVVLGVGVQRQLQSQGYVGLTRKQLLFDVLRNESDYNPRRIVQDSLPRILSQPGNVPIWRYLREAGLLDERGMIRQDSPIDSRISARASRGVESLLPAISARPRAKKLVAETSGSLASLYETYGLTDTLQYASMIPAESRDVEALRAFLSENSDAFEGDHGQPSYWAKLVSFFDFVTYGPATVPVLDESITKG